MTTRGSRAKVCLPPVVVIPEGQKHDSDCAVRAISMALGVPYEDVLSHAPLAWRSGVTRRRFHALAKAFGVRFRLRRNADYDDSTGLLWICHGTWAHLTYVHHGLLIDPSNGGLWKPSDYLSNGGGVATFYVIEPALQHGPRGGGHQVR